MPQKARTSRQSTRPWSFLSSNSSQHNHMVNFSSSDVSERKQTSLRSTLRRHFLRFLVPCCCEGEFCVPEVYMTITCARDPHIDWALSFQMPAQTPDNCINQSVAAKLLGRSNRLSLGWIITYICICCNKSNPLMWLQAFGLHNSEFVANVLFFFVGPQWDQVACWGVGGLGGLEPVRL